jgi:hypothetical protein
MTLQSGQTSEFKLPSHLQLGLESCPTCGQAIPPDKLEEISGRIAARERERTLAITAQLNMQYAADKARVEAKAKADLEEERQQNAVREMRVQAEMKELRRTNAIALEAARAEAKEREVEIQSQAKRTAESVAATRIEAVEAARRESESALQSRIDESEASRVAAEQKGTAIQLQLTQLRQANEAEVARIKQNAATEATRIRLVATETADLRFRDTLAAQEKVIAEARAKQLEAEQHASEAEQSLNAQREVLEKAGESAVNAERAKAFEEKQKLLTQVGDLKRALENKTNEELGEGAEINLLESLKAEFKGDSIEPIRKGAPGADIRQVVMFRGQECGTILYDSKNHKQWRDEHAAKLKRDQLAEKAEHAILSTHKFPRGAHQLHVQDGVLLANPARVVSVAGIVRQHMIQLHTARLVKIEREKKTAVLYEFVTSEHCRQLLDRVDERADALLALQDKEMRWHQNNWKHQGTAIRAIQKAKGDIASEIDSIIGTSGDDAGISEAS